MDDSWVINENNEEAVRRAADELLRHVYSHPDNCADPTVICENKMREVPDDLFDKILCGLIELPSSLEWCDETDQSMVYLKDPDQALNYLKVLQENEIVVTDFA